MNQKVVVVLSLTAIILSVLNLTLLLIPSILSFQLTLSNATQKIPLRVVNIVIQNVSEYYVVRMDVSLPEETPTLFNCHIQVDYLTKNNVWKTVSLNIGIVNYGEYIHPQLNLDSDFKSGDPYLVHDGHYHSYSGANLKVEAYGYSKP